MKSFYRGESILIGDRLRFENGIEAVVEKIIATGRPESGRCPSPGGILMRTTNGRTVFVEVPDGNSDDWSEWEETTFVEREGTRKGDIHECH